MGDETVFEGDENCSEESGGRPALQTAHREIGERNGGNTQGGGHHSHCNIWDVFVDPAGMGPNLSQQSPGSLVNSLGDLPKLEATVVPKD